MNALDNLGECVWRPLKATDFLAKRCYPIPVTDARRHVNKMCLAAGIPLIESGTSGYVGQVQPIMKDVTECFDCTSKCALQSC